MNKGIRISNVTNKNGLRISEVTEINKNSFNEDLRVARVTNENYIRTNNELTEDLEEKYWEEIGSQMSDEDIDFCTKHYREMLKDLIDWIIQEQKENQYGKYLLK